MNKTNNPVALRSQRELTNALFKLMKTTPYSEITVKAILIEAGLSRKTFYRNFEDKKDIINTFLDNLMNEYGRALKEYNDYHFPAMLKVITTCITENKEILTLFWQNELEYLILKKFNDYILKAHLDVIDYVPTRNDAYIVMMNNGAIWNIMNEWMRSGMKDSIEDVLEGVKEYLINIDEIDLTHLCRGERIQNYRLKNTFLMIYPLDKGVEI